MKTPSNAAKAASILHHTYGVTTTHQAIELYDQCMAQGLSPITDGFSWGIWEPFDPLAEELILASIEALALSIDQCREELK